MQCRVPVCAYSAIQSDGVSSIEVIVCDDGSVWTLTEDATTKTLAWSQDGVPPIPGSYADRVTGARGGV